MGTCNIQGSLVWAERGPFCGSTHGTLAVPVALEWSTDDTATSCRERQETVLPLSMLGRCHVQISNLIASRTTRQGAGGGDDEASSGGHDDSSSSSSDDDMAGRIAAALMSSGTDLKTIDPEVRGVVNCALALCTCLCCHPGCNQCWPLGVYRSMLSSAYCIVLASVHANQAGGTSYRHPAPHACSSLELMYTNSFA